MTANRKLATLALATGIGAMNLVTLGAAAQAGEYRHGHRDGGQHYSRPAPRFAGRDEHRDHRGPGRAIGAITLGALMAAAIIASEGSRHRDYDRD
jgi:hypothetical protein